MVKPGWDMVVTVLVRHGGGHCFGEAWWWSLSLWGLGGGGGGDRGRGKGGVSRLWSTPWWGKVVTIVLVWYGGSYCLSVVGGG